MQAIQILENQARRIDQSTPLTSKDGKRADRPPDDFKEQDRQGDIKQNTTNQGYQQDR